MTPVRRAAAALAFAAALGAQFLLQQPLGRANEVRASRKLHTTPSSLAFRLAAGGVKEAAADALWLTVLPKLGQPWVDPDRKGAWIEAVTTAMVDANPRALNPVIYAAYYLEFIRRRHPAIERVVRRALEAEARSPFREPERVNADSWILPEILGMNLYLHGEGHEKGEALDWLRRAAEKPGAPTILIDLVGAIRAREGSPLEGWDLWILRAAGTENEEWRESFLREADQARLRVIRRWARAAEERLGRWPGSVEEVLDEAPEAERAAWEAFPARREALVAGLRLHPATRDVEIEGLTAALVAEGTESLRLLLRHHELTQGRPARTLADLDSFGHRPVPPPPRHGTRWDLDPATGEPVVVPDPGDPRLRRPPPSLSGPDSLPGGGAPR